MYTTTAPSGSSSTASTGVELLGRRLDGDKEQVGLDGRGEFVVVAKEDERWTVVAEASEEGAEVRVARHDDASVRDSCTRISSSVAVPRAASNA
jgi:hypothetical protein